MLANTIPSEAGSVANNSQGFGRVDVQAVVGPLAAKEALQFFDEKKKLDAGEREDRTVTIPAGSSRLKVTLVWTDPPGEGLQSDLDLVVVANKQERHGNMPAGSKDFDRRNNVEQVIFAESAGRRSGDIGHRSFHRRRAAELCPRHQGELERLQAKWLPARAKKTRQNKRLELPF